jgi:hypothetical protein
MPLKPCGYCRHRSSRSAHRRCSGTPPGWDGAEVRTLACAAEAAVASGRRSLARGQRPCPRFSIMAVVHLRHHGRSSLSGGPDENRWPRVAECRQAHRAVGVPLPRMNSVRALRETWLAEPGRVKSLAGCSRHGMVRYQRAGQRHGAASNSAAARASSTAALPPTGRRSIIGHPRTAVQGGRRTPL